MKNFTINKTDFHFKLMENKDTNDEQSNILKLNKRMDSEPHKTPYIYVKYHHTFIPGTRECISGLLRKIFVFKVGKPSFFPASE